MSDYIDSIRTQLWAKMRGKSGEKGKRYRDSFVAAHLSANIAAQIQSMREARGWLQKDLATRADMSPPRISVLEDPSYENLNVKTLKRLASAFDVALMIKFVAFSELVNWVSALSPRQLGAVGFEQDRLEGLGQGATNAQAPVLGGSACEFAIGCSHYDDPQFQNDDTAAATGATRPEIPADRQQRGALLPQVPVHPRQYQQAA